MIDTESARKLFTQSCDFLLAAAAPTQFPDLAVKTYVTPEFGGGAREERVETLPEIAFIGRSNVGKSSLINALTGRKNLARTSNTPGRTQQIIFFNLGQRLMLADLPGYGHAKAPDAEKDRWNDLVNHYLQARAPLRCVCLLIDGRHGVMANDLAMMQFLDRAAVSYKLVLTKSDQIRSASDKDTRLRQTSAMLGKHQAALPDLLLTSSEKKDGIDDLKVFLTGYALPAGNS